MHRFGVPQNMWRDLLGQIWIHLSGGVKIFLQNICNACSGEFSPLVVRKQRLVGLFGAGQTIIRKIHSQSIGSAGHDRNESGLTPFPRQCNGRRLLQTDIAHSQIANLLDSRPGIIHETEQEHIPPPIFGRGIRLCKNTLHVIGRKIGDRRRRSLLCPQIHDFL